MSAGYYQPKLGQYDYYETISALRKTIKLGDCESAIYWLNVLLTYGGTSAHKSVAKQLWIMSAEDIDDERIVMRAFAVYQMAGKVNETDHLYFLTYQMCKAERWWTSETGSCVDYLWAKATGDLKKNPKKIPGFALDSHTAQGARAKKQGKTIDDRFSGTDIGRQQTKWLHDKYGRLDEGDYPGPEFYTYWEQYKELLGEQDEPMQQLLIGDAQDE